MEEYDRQYKHLIREYKILYRDVRLEYQFYKHENMKPEMKRVIEKESEINTFFLKMIQDTLTESPIDTTTPLGNIKQLQSDWNEQQRENQKQTGSLLAAERRNEIIQYNLNRERVFFFTNMVFICLFVFYVIYQEQGNDYIQGLDGPATVSTHIASPIENPSTV
jgi:hypothetical protein